MANAKWTFFYYCNAESDLFDNVITMMKNMAKLDYTSGNVNVVLLVDRIEIKRNMDVQRFYTEDKYHWFDTLCFVMKNGLDPIEATAVKPPGLSGDQDMGDQEVLKKFLNWGKQNFPADHYGFIIYGHGSGISVGNSMEYIPKKEALHADGHVSRYDKIKAKDKTDFTHILISRMSKHVSYIKTAAQYIPKKDEDFFQYLNSAINALDINNDNLFAIVASVPDKYQNDIRIITASAAEGIIENSFEKNFVLNQIEDLQTAILASKPQDDNNDYTALDRNRKLTEQFKFTPLSVAKKNSDLYVYELRRALDDTGFIPDILIFDSCFMMDFEIAYELKRSAKYLLGSQGFDSRAIMGNQLFLKYLTEEKGSVDPEALAKYIVDHIQDRLEIESPEAPTVLGEPPAPGHDWFFEEYCYSCLDLNQMDEVNTQLNAIIQLIFSGKINSKAVDDVRKDCHAFYVTPLPDVFYIGTIDLKGFLEKLQDKMNDADCKKTIGACITALEKAIIAKKAGEVIKPLYTPNGLSILFPSARGLEFNGATLLNTYWYNRHRKLFKNYTKQNCNWINFILEKRIKDWFPTIPH
jgi:hypothetical protein